MGSATADLKMRKGQYTVDGAGQGPWQSQGGTPQTRGRGLAKNHSKVTILAALTNLFLGRKKLLALVTQGQCVNPLF